MLDEETAIDERKELRARVEAKRKQIKADLAQMKAGLQGGRNRQIEQLEQKLESLKDNLKDGWDRLSNEAAGRLNRWLRDD